MEEAEECESSLRGTTLRQGKGRVGWEQQKIELRNNKVGNEERSKEWTREEGTADVIVGGTNLRPVR